MKRFNLSWNNSVRYSLDVEAESEDDAKDKFINGVYNLLDAEEQDGEMEEGSLDIVELED